MSNIKTTLAGVFTAVAAVITSTIQQGHSLLDWKTWLVPAGLAIFAYFSKDKTVNV